MISSHTYSKLMLTLRASMRKGALIGRLGFLTVMSFLVVNTAITIGSTVAASANYPGGLALMHFNNLTASTANGPCLSVICHLFLKSTYSACSHI